MNEGNRLLETDGGEDRAERLAGLGGIDRQRLASEVLLAIFWGLGPFPNAFHLGRIARVFEHLLLVRQHLLVLGTSEEVKMV
jgi:hypothetical protein